MAFKHHSHAMKPVITVHDSILEDNIVRVESTHVVLSMCNKHIVEAVEVM